MLKYKGKYRLCCEFNRTNLEPIKEDIHIQCYKGGQIYRVYENKLAYYRSSRGNSETLAKNLIELGVNGVNNCSTDGDILIYFDEDSLEIVTEKVGVVTSGADISPWSLKNLRKMDWFKEKKDEYIKNGYYKELSEEEKEIYRQRFKNNISEE